MDKLEKKQVFSKKDIEYSQIWNVGLFILELVSEIEFVNEIISI